jgi:rubredoxin
MLEIAGNVRFASGHEYRCDHISWAFQSANPEKEHQIHVETRSKIAPEDKEITDSRTGKSALL